MFQDVLANDGAAIAGAVRALDARGALSPAAIGRDRQVDPTIRGDRTAWFSELALPASLQSLWHTFEQLRLVLNRDAWMGLRDFELQLASYPGDGARYAPHVDTFRGEPVRRVTAIIYLNPDWKESHGGELFVETPDGSIRIAPKLGRMVVFRSDVVRHAVEPCWTARYAATGWFRGADGQLVR